MLLTVIKIKPKLKESFTANNQEHKAHTKHVQNKKQCDTNNFMQHIGVPLSILVFISRNFFFSVNLVTLYPREDIVITLSFFFNRVNFSLSVPFYLQFFWL